MLARINPDNTITAPYSLRDLRRDNPHISFPADPPAALLAEYGVHEVAETPEPDAPGQVVEDAGLALIDGVPTLQWAVRDATPEEIEQARASKLRQAQWMLRQTMAPISSIYPQEERDGWGEQVEAAQAVLMGGESALIDALAAARGVTAEIMAQTVIDKRDQYRALYGAVVARLGVLRGQIAAATTLADLEAIDVEAGWP